MARVWVKDRDRGLWAIGSYRVFQKKITHEVWVKDRDRGYQCIKLVMFSRLKWSKKLRLLRFMLTVICAPMETALDFLNWILLMLIGWSFGEYTFQHSNTSCFRSDQIELFLECVVTVIGNICWGKNLILLKTINIHNYAVNKHVVSLISAATM